MRGPLLAAALGALGTLAFAPFGLWPVQCITLAALFWLTLRCQTVRDAAWLGWAFGFGGALSGVHWLYITMHTYGGMPGWLSAFAVALLAALFFGPLAALGTAGASWLRRRWAVPAGGMALLLLPACRALSEWLGSWLLTGFPWLASGYAHNASPLAGYAPLLGVYGVGWLAATAAGCLALLLPAQRQAQQEQQQVQSQETQQETQQETHREPHQQPLQGPKQEPKPGRTWITPLLLAVGLFLGGALLQPLQWTRPHGQPISVRLLQGNVQQDLKFSRERLGASLLLYRSMVAAAPADLIAAPETALPMFLHQLPEDYLPSMEQFSKQTGSAVALGMLVVDGPGRYTNSLVGIGGRSAADGRGGLGDPAQPAQRYRYDKHHLVPFGEYVPPGFRWFVDMMRIPMADQTPGQALQAPFGVKDQWVLPNICFEDLFGAGIARQLAAAHFSGGPQASILLNVSNLAWFDDSIALQQHLQISQMRAIETGRPMLRATNTGASAVIGPKGDVLAQLPQLRQATLAAEVQGMTGNTPYLLLGNGGPLLCCALALAAGWLGGRKNRKMEAKARKGAENG